MCCTVGCGPLDADWPMPKLWYEAKSALQPFFSRFLTYHPSYCPRLPPLPLKPQHHKCGMTLPLQHSPLSSPTLFISGFASVIESECRSKQQHHTTPKGGTLTTQAHRGGYQYPLAVRGGVSPEPGTICVYALRTKTIPFITKNWLVFVN